MVVLVLKFLDHVYEVNVCFFDIEVEWIDFLERVDRLEVQQVGLRNSKLVLREIYVTNARISFESCLVFAYPETSLHLEFVIREEKPAKI